MRTLTCTLILCLGRATSAQDAAPPAEPVAPKPESPAVDPAPADTLALSMPYVRIDRGRSTVEFDGFVPVDAHIAEAPNLYLEVLVCTPDVRAHESLVATKASPSHIHAAMLLLGLEPGAPGSWTWDGTKITTHAPTGPRVEISFVWTDDEGVVHEDVASDWVKSAVTGQTLTATIPEGSPRWVFAGSKMVARNGREWYAAEAEGTVVGLHTFGSETIAWCGVFSPSAEVQDPEWIADPARVPKVDTRVIVRVRVVPDAPAQEPDR